MQEKIITVNLENSVEATPLALFVQKANDFDCNVHIGETGKIMNAKSIMGVMSLNFRKGNQLILRTEGADEQKAMTELVDFFESIK